MTAERVFPYAFVAVTQARHYVLDILERIGDGVAGDAAVMVSELATNSVRHAASGFTVSVDRTTEHITVAVADPGPGEPRMCAPKPTDGSGRGLRIVNALADEWGVETNSGPGKSVWFTIANVDNRFAKSNGSSSSR